MADGVRIDASDLRKVGKIARAFGPELTRQLKRNLRAAGVIGAAAAKESILAMPTKNPVDSGRHTVADERGSGSFTLRELIAQAVTVNVSTTRLPDVRIRVRRTPALQQIGAGGLAKAINTGQWKHPVFGDREVWVQQTGFEFFDKKIEEHREEMTALVAAALDEAAKVATAKGRL